MDETTELRDGNIYRWSWINPPEHEPYWCKTRMALAKKGKLFDLFWVHHGSKFRQGGWGPTCQNEYALPIDRIELNLIANINDMDEIQHGDEQYYHPSDVMDLRHSNNGMAPLYVKKGATRSAEKIAERIRKKMADAERDRQWAEQKVKELREKLAYVESGENLDSVWF